MSRPRSIDAVLVVLQRTCSKKYHLRLSGHEMESKKIRPLATVSTQNGHFASKINSFILFPSYFATLPTVTEALCFSQRLPYRKCPTFAPFREAL